MKPNFVILLTSNFMCIQHQILYYSLIYCILVNDYACPGCPRYKPFGFEEDLHGHNYVFIVLS